MATVTRGALVDLERTGWKALCTDGESAAAFYDDVLAREVLMLLPGGLVIDDRAAVVDAMRGASWSSVELDDVRVMALGEDCTLVAYRAVARRPDGGEYAALFNSTYVRRDGDWKLAVHQQTPM